MSVDREVELDSTSELWIRYHSGEDLTCVAHVHHPYHPLPSRGFRGCTTSPLRTDSFPFSGLEGKVVDSGEEVVVIGVWRILVAVENVLRSPCAE